MFEDLDFSQKGILFKNSSELFLSIRFGLQLFSNMFSPWKLSQTSAVHLSPVFPSHMSPSMTLPLVWGKVTSLHEFHILSMYSLAKYNVIFPIPIASSGGLIQDYHLRMMCVYESLYRIDRDMALGLNFFEFNFLNFKALGFVIFFLPKNPEGVIPEDPKSPEFRFFSTKSKDPGLFSDKNPKISCDPFFHEIGFTMKKTPLNIIIQA